MLIQMSEGFLSKPVMQFPVHLLVQSNLGTCISKYGGLWTRPLILTPSRFIMQLEHTDKSAEGETVSNAQAKHILPALMALFLLEAVLLRKFLHLWMQMKLSFKTME